MLEKIIKLVLIDNHVLLRSGVRSMLAAYPDIDVVGETSCEYALEMITRLVPEVVILDLICSGSSNHTNLIAEILQECPSTHILILGNSAEDKNVMQGFKQGALGCLLYESPPQDLYNSITTLANGGSYLPPTIGKKIIQGYTRTHRTRPLSVPVLSAQQMQVLKLIGQGHTNQEIANMLVISKRTVEMHAYKIFKKLKVTNRTQAIQMALRWGLIDVVDWPAAVGEVVV